MRVVDVSSPPDVVECPELAYVVDAARVVAWTTHANVVGLRYAERKDALARLRGALAMYDRERAARAVDAALGRGA